MTLGSQFVDDDSPNAHEYGFKPYQPEQEIAIGGESWDRNHTVKTIPLERGALRASQKHIHRPAVDLYKKVGWAHQPGRPEVVRHGGEDVVWNGHHRIAAAMEKGHTSMDVDYIDLDHLFNDRRTT